MIEENLRIEKQKEPSSKEFGIVFAVVFLLISLLPLVKHHPIRLWALPVSGLFLLFALFYPKALAPLAKQWMKVGFFLHKIMNPLILGAIFFLVFTPFGLLLRLCGMKFLKLNWDKKASTYWINREPPGPDSLSFKNQF